MIASEPFRVAASVMVAESGSGPDRAGNEAAAEMRKIDSAGISFLTVPFTAGGEASRGLLEAFDVAL